jgi:hypothetical protein
MIRERTRAGLAAARAEGRSGGRRPKLKANPTYRDSSDGDFGAKDSCGSCSALQLISRPNGSDDPAWWVILAKFRVKMSQKNTVNYILLNM